MIALQMPAHAECEERGCDSRLPVKLCLTATGALVWTPLSPKANGWQVKIDPTDGVPVFHTRCPEHRQTVEAVTPPIIKPALQ